LRTRFTLNSSLPNKIDRTDLHRSEPNSREAL